MVNGFMSLGVILYLSTFPLGNAGDDCAGMLEYCGNRDCCDDLTCSTRPTLPFFPRPSCQNCVNENKTCENYWDCCDDMTCFNLNKTCQPCLTENSICGENYPDCCYGFDCLSGTCEKCQKMGQKCGDDSDLDCCKDFGLTCFREMCYQCSPSTYPCDENNPACCDGLTCKGGNCQA